MELLGRTVPPFVRVVSGTWSLWWDDVPKIVRGHDVSISDESKRNYRDAVAKYKARVAALHDDPLDVGFKQFDDAYVPREYQARGSQGIHGGHKVLLADSCGLGKTLGAWGARELILRDAAGAKTVIVCPSGLKYQWANEVAGYSKKPVRHMYVVDGGKSHRMRMYHRYITKSESVLILNYDILWRDVKELSTVFSVATYVIADEASKIKTRSTKTAKILKSLTRGVRWKVAITATPIEVGCENLHSIVEWLDPTLLGSKAMFDELYVRKVMIRCRNGRRFPKVIGYKNLNHLRRRIKCVMLRRRLSDVGSELPPVIPSDVLLDFDPKHRAAYDEARDGCREKLKDNAAGPMVAVLDAKRACLSPMMVEGHSGVGAKTTAIVDLLAYEAADEKALVFVESQGKRYMKKELVPALKKAGVKVAEITGDTSDAKREGIKAGFNSGAVRVLVMDGVGTYGLNLPCSLVVNADLPWNPAMLEQRIGRARRMSSGIKHVRVVNYMMRDSVEQKVLKRLFGRSTLAEAIVGESDILSLDRISSKEWGKML
jgi:SNF2 family DNA or RNA helicase